VIEDKTGLKQNSLHENISDHTQEDIVVFTEKIRKGLLSRIHEDFMIIARIESLIIGKGQSDALDRAKAYIAAGAGAIMIHSKDPTGEDIRLFTSEYNKFKIRKPLLLVPTSYDTINEVELASWGANIIVYANQLLRAAYPAMERAAEVILEDGRACGTAEFSSSIEDFLKMIPGS
jgi:phosphoenolpyruvate phosphomutase / 2-hydroxyethylphosphonate cytidylyltransferase